MRRHPERAALVQRCAAAASGVAFYLYPSGQLLAHALATAVEQCWANDADDRRRLHRRRGSPIVDALHRLPFARLFYPLAFAYLCHVRIFQPWLAPPVLMDLMHQTTNGR